MNTAGEDSDTGNSDTQHTPWRPSTINYGDISDEKRRRRIIEREFLDIEAKVSNTEREDDDIYTLNHDVINKFLKGPYDLSKVCIFTCFYFVVAMVYRLFCCVVGGTIHFVLFKRYTIFVSFDLLVVCACVCMCFFFPFCSCAPTNGASFSTFCRSRKEI